MRKMKELGFSLLVVFGILVTDQVVKAFVVRLGLPYVLNTGGVFGVFPRSFWIGGVGGLVLLALVGYRVFWSRTLTLADSAALGLVVGGGLSNVVDRVLRGGVVDFLSVGFGPLFNTADLAIVSGVGIALWDMVRSRQLTMYRRGRGET